MGEAWSLVESCCSGLSRTHPCTCMRKIVGLCDWSFKGYFSQHLKAEEVTRGQKNSRNTKRHSSWGTIKMWDEKAHIPHARRPGYRMWWFGFSKSSEGTSARQLSFSLGNHHCLFYSFFYFLSVFSYRTKRVASQRDTYIHS